MKKVAVAYPTIFLFIFSFGSWLALLILGHLELIPFVVALISCALLSFICFTPVHDASHRSIFFSKTKSILFIESLIGHLGAATFFAPYETFKILHLQHHSFTNIKEKDPDFWVATRNPIALFFKAITIKLSYYFFVLFRPSKVLRQKRIYTLCILTVFIAIIYLVPRSLDFFILWFGSASISLTILAILFDWLPHTPHTETDRYKHTRIIKGKWLQILTINQSYHLIHHLYPKVPFYLYTEKFKEIEQTLIEKGSPIQ